MKHLNSKDFQFYAIILVFALAVGLITGNMNKNSQGTAAAPAAAPAETVTADTSAGVKTAKVAETGTGVQIVKAEDYAETFPLQYTSYMQNDENSEVVEYTEQNPYIKTLYEGYGFAISYGSARGHTYVVTDLSATGRPHKLANCYTCKTSSFTAEVLNEGDSAYAMAFDDFTGKIEDAFGCFHCHANGVGDGSITVTHPYLTNAVAGDFESIDAANLSCGQCHSEYYFDPATKATTFAYVGLANMTPDLMLEYENKLVDGEGNMFADWVDEDTGVRKLKVQHPEFETFLNEGSPHGGPNAVMSFTCADCHMPQKTAEDGTQYTSHYWVSPLSDQNLLDNTCAKCHKDLAGEVAAIQKETTDRENQLGEALAQLDTDLAAAIAEGKIEGQDLEDIRMLFRNAQWFWDFVYVENSEGVHNMQLTAHCLDKAEEYINQANAMLK